MKRDSPAWMRIVLLAAAVYNLAWGAWVVARPGDLFHWTGIEPPRYPAIWQCVGMVVGVYGIGYAIASRDPLRHWPITLVGLSGKILGPLGFAYGLWSGAASGAGALPPSWAATLVTNDLIWWIPFAAILYQAFRGANLPETEETLSVAVANQRFETDHGESIADLSRQRTVLLLFLRHAGCTFCREALADLSRQRSALEARGLVPVVVHMGTDADARTMLRRYGLEDLRRISDPDCVLYRSYELPRGGVRELFGPPVWWRGFKAAIMQGHGLGKLVGDGFQMGGVFLVRQNKAIRSLRHRTPADRPDYCQLASDSTQCSPEIKEFA